MIRFTMKWCSPVLIFIMLHVAIFGGNIEVAHATDNAYYVDSVNGSDSNDGLSSETAWKSLEKVNGTEFMPGDRILLKAGGVWTGQLYPKGSGIEGNPITIDQYGTGSKPLIQGNGLVGGAVYLHNQPYMVIQNLEVTNKSDTMVDGIAGILVEATDFGTVNSIKILNNYVHEVRGGQDKYYGGIAVRALGSSVSTIFNDVLIEGNRVDDVSRTGIVTYSKWRLRAGVTSGNGAFAGWTNVVVRNNAVQLTFGDGILVTNTVNALIEHNVNSHANTNDLGLYNAGIWAWNADNTVIQYNEAYATQSTNDGQGFDIDYAQNGTIVQYNYSHDNEGGFLLLASDGAVGRTTTNSIARYNISQNDLERVIHATGTVQNAEIYNNTIYVRPGLSTKIIHHSFWGGIPDNIAYYNNIIVNYGSGGYKLAASTNTKFDYNLFYGNHPATEPADPRKIIADPLLANPGTALDRHTVDGYLLKAGSPALSSGVLIANNGSKDYWGNPVSASEVPNRGAYNGAGITYSVPVPAPSELTLLSDNFNDGDAVGWNPVAGQAANWTIVNDVTPRYQGSAPSGDAEVASLQEWSNVSLQASVKSSLMASGGSVSLIARNNGNSFYRFGYSESTGTWNIWKKNTGFYTLLKRSTPFTYSLNTEYTVRAVLNGNNLSLQVDSGSGFVTVCSVVDNSLTTGLVGLLTYKSTNSYDDVIVSPIVTNIGFNPTGYSVAVGSTVNPVVSATLFDNTTAALTRGVAYSSSNPNVAIVDAATGVVTGIAPGSTDITATYQGQTATAIVTVALPPAPASIRFTQAGYAVSVGTTVDTGVDATYSDNSTTALRSGVAYASLNSNVVMVNAATGVITGVAVGSTNITATYLGKTATVPITVAQPLFSDNFNDGNGTGWNVISGSAANWTIVNDGTPRYRAGSPNGESTVTAGESWSDISLQARVKTTGISPDGSLTLIARYKDPNNYYRFSYNEASDKWIIWKKKAGSITLLAKSASVSHSVNTEYTVRAVLKGNNLSLQVDSGSGFITLCSVTDDSFASGLIGLQAYKSTSSFDDVIVSPLDVDPTTIPAITIDQTALSLTVGDAAAKLNATVTNSTYAPVWTSSNPAVALVNSNGEVTPLAAGTAVITATLSSGIATAQCVVTVLPANQGGQPAMALTGPSAVQIGQDLHVSLGINSVSTAVYAQDIVMNYDANLFEFVSASSVKNGVNIVQQVASTPGALRLILASAGTTGAVTGDTPLVELIFKAKIRQQSAAGNIEVTSATLGDSHGNEITAVTTVKRIDVQTTPIAIPGDITLDGKVSIGDLSMVAANYGKNTVSSDWEQVKAADVNHDGNIDILDLTFIAQKILE